MPDSVCSLFAAEFEVAAVIATSVLVVPRCCAQYREALADGLAKRQLVMPDGSISRGGQTLSV